MRKYNWDWFLPSSSHNAGTRQNQVGTSKLTLNLPMCDGGGGSGAGVTHRSRRLLGTVTSQQSHTRFKVNTISLVASSVCSCALWEPEMKQCLKSLHRLGPPELFVLGHCYQSVSGEWVTKAFCFRLRHFLIIYREERKCFLVVRWLRNPKILGLSVLGWAHLVVMCCYPGFDYAALTIYWINEIIEKGKDLPPNFVRGRNEEW